MGDKTVSLEKKTPPHLKNSQQQNAAQGSHKKNQDPSFNQDWQDLINTAEEHFKENRYSAAESILNQLILNGCKSALIFHMLGSIYYDQGKFNKGIRAFQRALQLDPAYTDASVGLSIILNDLGRYSEGQKVFEDAQALLKKSQNQGHQLINEKLAVKHDELAELYFQYARYNEALEQFYKALTLSQRKVELRMKVAETYFKLESYEKAVRELKIILEDHPEYFRARLKLGNIYFARKEVQLAREQWQTVLRLEPDCKEARQLLNQLDQQKMGLNFETGLSTENLF